MYFKSHKRTFILERTCISAQALRNFFCQILFTFATTHYARDKYFLLSHYALRRGSRHTYIFHYAKSFQIWSTICTRPFKVVRSYAILIFKYILLSQLRTTHHQNTFYFFYYALRRASRHTYICSTCMSAPVLFCPKINWLFVVGVGEINGKSFRGTNFVVGEIRVFY